MTLELQNTRVKKERLKSAKRRKDHVSDAITEKRGMYTHTRTYTRMRIHAHACTHACECTHIQVSDALKEELDGLSNQESALHAMMTNLFQNIFVQRYRDTNDEVRACCISAIGRAVSTLPSFLNDQHLKYLAWVLNDSKSAVVRRRSLSPSPPDRSSAVCRRYAPAPPS